MTALWCDECGAGPFERGCARASHIRHAHETTQPVCSDLDCDQVAVKRGMCESHYHRARRAGLRVRNPDGFPRVPATGGTEWMDDAACKGNGHLFFPPRGERSERRAAREHEALALCAQCPVRFECLEDALAWEHDSRLPVDDRAAVQWVHGIRGGLTAIQRIAILRTRRRMTVGAAPTGHDADVAGPTASQQVAS